MGFEWSFGHGKVLPVGYSVLANIDLPIHDYDYFTWVYLKVRLFWFITVNRKVAARWY